VVQAQAGKAPDARQKVSLAKPIDWGTFTVRLFNDSNKVTFQLSTSWIPGEKHKGLMRYKLKAFPEVTEGQTTATNPQKSTPDEALLEHVHACVISLHLYDSDGFMLRSINVSFTFGVDDQARLRGLSTNSSVQMDAQEYRQFVGSVNASGFWNVSWACAPD
jgi:hypothetical protein